MMKNQKIRQHVYISQREKVREKTDVTFTFIQSRLFLVSHQFEPCLKLEVHIAPPRPLRRAPLHNICRQIPNPSSSDPEPAPVSHNPRGVFVNKHSASERRLNEEKCSVSLAAKVNGK